MMLNIVTSLSASQDSVDLEKCILCQTSKRDKLSEGEKGKQNLLDAARILKDDEKSKRIIAFENEIFRYHATSCYSTFIKTSKRKLQPQAHSSNSEIPFETTRPKRQKIELKEICVICGQDRIWDKTTDTRIHKRFRLCEQYSAQKLLNAAELNRDEVYTRIIFCYEGGTEDVFANDIHYHNKCLRKYFKRYDSKIDLIMENLDKEDDANKDSSKVVVMKSTKRVIR